jgi:hypothetical protein
VELLSKVREVEVAREGTRHLLGALRGEPLDERLRLRERGVVVLVVRADGQLAQALDVGEEIVTAGLAQHCSEQPAEEADIVSQRVGHLVVRTSATVVQGSFVMGHEATVGDARPMASSVPTGWSVVDRPRCARIAR